MPLGTCRISYAAALAGVVTAGCFPPDEGRTPPLDRIYFPVGLALNAQGTRLYVANSDFDLQFNAGTLQAYDLEALRRAAPHGCSSDADCETLDGVARSWKCDSAPTDANGGIPSHFCVDPADPRPCGARGEKSASDRLSAPGRCDFLEPKPFLKASVRIGSFVTDVVYRERPPLESTGQPDGTGRLFLPVRGDATLHWIDVGAAEPGETPKVELECGQGDGTTCDANHRRGDEPTEENTRDVRLPPEPFGVAVDESGTSLVTTHQTDGSVSLFVNRWGEGGGTDGPRLEFVLGGLPAGALGIAALPVPAFVAGKPDAYQQSFLVTFRNAAEVRLVRFFPDAEASPARPFLEAARSAAITTNSLGWNSRGIALDDSARRDCEAGCANDEACLRDCAAKNGVDAYVANRTPASVVVGSTPYLDPAVASDAQIASNDLPRFHDSVPVSVGVSRVVTGDVLGRDGKPLHRIFAVCFDSKKIYVYDPKAGRVETIIQTGSGPHSLAIDGPHGLGYVGHFSESYLGVIDLDQSHTSTYGTMILTVGEPTPPRASK